MLVLPTIVAPTEWRYPQNPDWVSSANDAISTFNTVEDAAYEDGKVTAVSYGLLE